MASCEVLSVSGELENTKWIVERVLFENLVLLVSFLDLDLNLEQHFSTPGWSLTPLPLSTPWTSQSFLQVHLRFRPRRVVAFAVDALLGVVRRGVGVSGKGGSEG